LFVPVLIDGAGDAHQSVVVFHKFQQIRRCKELDAVRGRITVSESGCGAVKNVVG